MTLTVICGAGLRLATVDEMVILFYNPRVENRSPLVQFTVSVCGYAYFSTLKRHIRVRKCHLKSEHAAAGVVFHWESVKCQHITRLLYHVVHCDYRVANHISRFRFWRVLNFFSLDIPVCFNVRHQPGSGFEYFQNSTQVISQKINKDNLRLLSFVIWGRVVGVLKPMIHNVVIQAIQWVSQQAFKEKLNL